MHPDSSFRNGSGAATKWWETIQNLSFRLKEVERACLLQKKQETVLEAQTRALNVPRYRFLQRVKCGYEMAWNHPKHEFSTEIVDWACSLRQNKKWFWRHKLVHLMHPILIFTMGQVRQRNGVKPPETRVLDIKYVVRNQPDILEHRNCVQIPNM